MVQNLAKERQIGYWPVVFWLVWLAVKSPAFIARHMCTFDDAIVGVDPFTPTEVGTHLPTSEGWRAELAQEGRLHQTVDISAQSQECLGSINHRPLSVRIEPMAVAIASAIKN